MKRKGGEGGEGRREGEGREVRGREGKGRIGGERGEKRGEGTEQGD